MRHFHYTRPEDFYKAQAALMHWVRQKGDCNYLHKGDIGHRLYNNCYGYDPADMFHYWLDEGGEIGAFAILSPQRGFIDLQVAPDWQHSERHIAILRYCERETLRVAQRYDKPIKEITVEAFDCDPAYIAFLEAQGYGEGKLAITITRHDLTQLPDADLPAGFHFHQATAADAARLADVHNHSFTNKWDAEAYGAVFRSPHMEMELVVIAPDGRCAAFTNLWIDTVNRSLLFEPVGTHSDFRRLGIAKALMVHALRLMQAEHGINCAYVGHEPPTKKPASGALYAAVGFKRLYDVYDYSRRL